MFDLKIIGKQVTFTVDFGKVAKKNINKILCLL